MKIAIFDSHKFEGRYFELANKKFNHELNFFNFRLTDETVKIASGFSCVCCFVNDKLTKKNIESLYDGGTRLIALRSAGYNHVDLATAERLGIKVVRVPGYSPHAIAEHAVALILTLNRKTHRAFNRIREGNFSLDGLVGFDLFRKKVGIIGTGKIGRVMAQIMSGFHCEIFAYDTELDHELIEKYRVKYVDLETLFKESEIISLHLPLNPKTFHLLDDKAFSQMKPNVMLINTGRGALIDTKAMIKYLKNGHVGYAGLDVYEEEEGVFFEDLSEHILQDDTLARLLTFPNVILTSHQAFLTDEALMEIAYTTLDNVKQFELQRDLTNQVTI